MKFFPYHWTQLPCYFLNSYVRISLKKVRFWKNRFVWSAFFNQYFSFKLFHTEIAVTLINSQFLIQSGYSSGRIYEKLLPLANYWQPANTRKNVDASARPKVKTKKATKKNHRNFHAMKKCGAKKKAKQKWRGNPKRRENSARVRYFWRNSRKCCDKVDYRLKSRYFTEVPTEK